ncbi:GNAT family N-acetyltransferase [Palleniella muris]|uniref:GNAT family N-acetyltransferase n=1 Tax=Palleniella muris TaxID=3038145 RepID=A0AC61QNL3_9BACT|nr:GNAT family N-acetyltransferase [Palleniella muris]TGX81147.1 GNAT family N-acetyltransferase [Palleniella muris]
MEIRNLEHTDFDTLFHGFEKAFADYEIHFEKEEVRSMLIRRGYNPKLSFAAFVNNEIVAFTLNGTGTFNGIPTAYDTGTGTVKECRGQRIAGKIFTYSIPFLKEAGISQYLLEVMQNNQKAIGVYRRMDFEVTREFDCFRQTIDHIDNRKVNTDCSIEQVNADAIREAQHYCDFSPSWQNSFESIERGIAELRCLGAFLDGKMVGYCVFDIHTGDLTQIAVLRECRRKRVASRLLQEVTARMKTDFIKVLNISPNNTTMSVFLESKNIPLASRQFEMILPL